MSEHRFPPDFIWGVAASAYQIEGAVAEGGRGPSVWDTFSHLPGKTARGETGDVAIDHYHRMEEDVDIIAGLGVDAYRFSIAWPRLLPGGTGDVNREGVDFYRRLCERLHDRGVTPLATLYHWDLPQALQDEGGWQDPRSPGWFAEYAAVAKEYLGDLISLWTTLNEPWCAAFLAHGSGMFAPGISDPTAAYVAAHHLMLGHHRAVEAMRETAPREGDRFGIVLNVIPARPADPGNSDDVRVAAIADDIHNRMFLDTTFFGTYPDSIRELHRRFGVDDRVDIAEMETARADIDLLGVNYYNINRFEYRSDSPGMGEFPGADEAVMARPPDELTEMDWGVEPHGLTEVLCWVDSDYPGIPIYVTENGAAYPDEVRPDGSVDDPKRIDYLERHVTAVAEAMEEGVDVRGYFAWSVFDNFEWALGYSKRFGLVRVDYDTLERTVKASGRWYRDFIASQRRE
jgi:beta-glucosidase